MNRRQLIGALGIGGAVVATSSPAVMAAAIIAKPKPEPLPMLQDGDVLTGEVWRALVGRVNDLSAQ